MSGTVERCPTGYELGLVAGVFTGDITIVVEDGELLWIGHGTFDPLYNHNDLARLVEAMQAKGWFVRRSHLPSGINSTDVFNENTDALYQQTDPSDLKATYWAIVKTLAEQETAP